MFKSYQSVLAVFLVMAMFLLTAVNGSAATQHYYYHHHRPSKTKHMLVGAGAGAVGGALIGGPAGAVVGAGAGTGAGYMLYRHRKHNYERGR